MLNIQVELEKVFTAAIRQSFPQLVDFPQVVVAVASLPKFGDYQFNGAMGLSQLLKTSTKQNPREVAATIVTNVQALDSTLIDNLEVAGPGFINIRI